MLTLNRGPRAAASLLGPLLLGAMLGAQQAQKPLTNDGVVQLVKAGLPESVIIGAIQSSPPSYDISAGALIKLNQAGVTPDEMKAIIAAQQAGKTAGADSAAAANASAGGSQAPASTSQARWEMPSVEVLPPIASGAANRKDAA